MKLQTMGPLDEVFSHVDDKTGETRHFNITAMARNWQVRTRPTVTIPVDPEVAQFFIQKRGIEHHRVRKIIGERVHTPLLVLHWPDGTHLVVDGHHRYVAASMTGLLEVPAKLIPRSIWRKFIITDLPAEDEAKLLNSFSGKS